jgi:hypothetical protein
MHQAEPRSWLVLGGLEVVFDFIEEVGGGRIGADVTTVGWLDEQSGWFVDYEQVVVFVQQMSLDVNVEFPCNLKVVYRVMTESLKADRKSAHKVCSK